MSDNFLQRVLAEPPYGWTRDSKFYKPTVREMLSHWLARMNLFRDRRNWLAVSGWAWPLALLPFAVVFFTQYFSWTLALAEPEIGRAHV